MTSPPLWFACQEGHAAVVQLLLASGREIDTKMRPTFNGTTAAEQGRCMATRKTKPKDETEEDFQRKKTNGPKCADLIDEYEKDPDGVRTRLRRELGLPGSFIFNYSFRSPVLTHCFISALKRPLQSKLARIARFVEPLWLRL